MLPASTPDARRWFGNVDWLQLEDIKTKIKDRLEEGYGITQSNLEFERPDRAHENADRYGHGRFSTKEKEHVQGNTDKR